MFAEQESAHWCLRLIQTDRLRARTSGSSAIAIAMIDGAVDGRHPDFSGSDIRVLPASNSSVCQHTQSEACQHGTFVAGILAARRISRAPALTPGCPLLSFSLFCEADAVSECPLVRPTHVAHAIRTALKAGARIINLSLGLLNPRRPDLHELFKCYEMARAQDVLIVAAGGNQGECEVNPLFEHEWVIPVAACNSFGQLTSKSNTGGRLVRSGLLAPGVDVLSTASGGGYTTMTGTSVAAPFVTGVLALLWSLFPNASAREMRTAILHPRNVKRQGIPPLLNAESSLSFLSTQCSRLRKDLSPMDSTVSLSNTDDLETFAQELISVPIPGGKSTLSALAIEASPLSLRKTRPVAASNAVTPQGGCGCGGKPSLGFVYAIGTIKPVFPSTGLHNEYMAAFKSLGASGSPTQYDVFKKFPYITELMCWVLEIDNVDTYVVKPRSGVELADIVESFKPLPPAQQGQQMLTTIVGTLGGMSSPTDCAGLVLHQATANQIFTFTLDELLKKLSGNNLETQTIRELLTKLIVNRPNKGATPGDRAINFVALRYPEVFKKFSQLTTPSQSPTPTENAYFLTAVSTRPSAASGTRLLEDVIFAYQKYSTDEQEFYYTSVDVSGQFPFINTPLRVYLPEE